MSIFAGCPTLRFAIAPLRSVMGAVCIGVSAQDSADSLVPLGIR
jgi:hypothetical protein